MGQASKIQWTDNTFNPWWGCEKVSPGCAHCYAERDSRRWGSFWGAGSVRRFFNDAHWNEPLKWNRRAERSGVPEKVFCASYADVCEDRPDLIEPRKRLAGLIEATPHLTWQLLTKRPENFGLMGWDVFPPNVWAMTTAEDQERADLRIPELLKAKARIHGVSYEPALGPVDFSPWLRGTTIHHMRLCIEGAIRNRAFKGFTDDAGKPLSTAKAEAGLRQALAAGSKYLPMGPKCEGWSDQEGCPGHRKPRINWLIGGGESGAAARPSHPAWIRATRDQCVAAGVPFFFKQWGEYSMHEHLASGEIVPSMPMDAFAKCLVLKGNAWVRMDGFAPGTSIEEVLDQGGGVYAARVGTIAAGRLLDGRLWEEFPQ